MEAKEHLTAKLAVKLADERADIGRAIDALTFRRKQIDEDFAAGFDAMASTVTKFEVIAGDVKVTVAKNVNVVVDHLKVDAIRREIDPKVFPFKVEYKPIAAKMGALKQFNEELFAVCAGALTDNPGKAKVSLKVDPKNNLLQNGIFPKAVK